MSSGRLTSLSASTDIMASSVPRKMAHGTDWIGSTSAFTSNADHTVLLASSRDHQNNECVQGWLAMTASTLAGDSSCAKTRAYRPPQQKPMAPTLPLHEPVSLDPCILKGGHACWARLGRLG